MGEPIRSLSERFARRDDPPHKPSGILYVVGEADRSYLQNVEWSPARVTWGERYETLMAKARRQLPSQRPEQGLQATMWGRHIRDARATSSSGLHLFRRRPIPMTPA